MDANKFLLQGAMASGNLDLAKTLSPKPGEFLLYGQLAAAGGHLHILKWLEEQNFEHFEYLSQSAAKAGMKSLFGRAYFRFVIVVLTRTEFYLLPDFPS